MSSRIYPIFQGPVAAAPTAIILGTASAGTPGAPRTLTHPDSATFPPIVYSLRPDRTLGLDNEVLVAPVGATVLTLSSRLLNAFGGNLSDQVVTEIWTAEGVKAPMPTFFFRLLFEYFANPPAFAQPEVFIQWAPADRSTKTYNVQLVDFTVGGGPGGDPTQRYDVDDKLLAGGKDDGGDTRHGLDEFDDAGGGIMDRTVTLVLKVVSEVA